MTSSDIRIREAKPDDYTDVAEMHYPVWRRSWTGILTPFLLDVLGPAKRWVAEVYPQSLNREGWSMWLAESGGQTIGVTIFGPDATDSDHLLIDALYVTEESQRRGVGGGLLDTAMSARPSGDVVLWCAEKNGRARRFYENRNFRMDGRTLDWEPLPGVIVPHVGYRLTRR